jgi:hypothetical protein
VICLAQRFFAIQAACGIDIPDVALLLAASSANASRKAVRRTAALNSTGMAANRKAFTK